MNETRGQAEAPKEPSAEQKADAIRDEIDRTRSDLGQTLAAIEQKLDPATLREKAVEEIQVVEDRVKAAVKEQIEETREKLKVELAQATETVKREVTDALDHAKKAVRAATIGKVETMARRANDTTIEARDTILDTLWQNPLPTVLAGVGLTWLFMNRRSANASHEPPPRYGDSEWRRPQAMHDVSQRAADIAGSAGRAVSHATDAAGRAVSHGTDAVGHAVHDAADRAGHLVHDAADAAGRVAHQVSEGASHLAHEASDMGTQAMYSARDQARRVDRSLQQALHDNPIAVGAAVVAAGALVGMALPRTKREDALMGSVRDDLLEKARGAAEDAMGSAKELAHHGLQDIKTSIESGAPASHH
jgi:RNA-binding protein YhbY